MDPSPSLTPTFLAVGLAHLLAGGLFVFSSTVPGCQTQLTKPEPLAQQIRFRQMAAVPLNEKNQATVAKLLEKTRKKEIVKNRPDKADPKDPPSRFSFFRRSEPVVQPKPKPKPPVKKKPEPKVEPVLKKTPEPKTPKPKVQPKPKPKPEPKAVPEMKLEPQPKPKPPVQPKPKPKKKAEPKKEVAVVKPEKKAPVKKEAPKPKKKAEPKKEVAVVKPEKKAPEKKEAPKPSKTMAQTPPPPFSGEKVLRSKTPIVQPKPRVDPRVEPKASPVASQPRPRASKEIIPKAVPVKSSERRNVSIPPNTPARKRSRNANAVTTVSPAILARYQQHIHDVFMGKWTQPPGIESSGKARIHIRIRRDGTISEVRLISSSRNGRLDASALAAARSVRKVNPLPRGLNQKYYEPIINFELN